MTLYRAYTKAHVSREWIAADAILPWQSVSSVKWLFEIVRAKIVKLTDQYPFARSGPLR
jgi:hypothetical protein